MIFENIVDMVFVVLIKNKKSFSEYRTKSNEKDLLKYLKGLILL